MQLAQNILCDERIGYKVAGKAVPLLPLLEKAHLRGASLLVKRGTLVLNW